MRNENSNEPTLQSEFRVPHSAFEMVGRHGAAPCSAFYETLLPAVGFSQRVAVEGWLQFEAAGETAMEFFGVTESPGHVPNENRIAIWAESRADVDRIAKVAVQVGARNIEGPMNYEAGYYAVFFEDPCGNRLEVCHRLRA